MRRGGGEIVEVHGGHIVRSTGRKDRHSKVCTAKGPRDRRVRLSAPTAIQFYDVQDRLGFDRPSKAVDWLIKKAKAAIDKLAELPAWKPTATAVPPSDGLHQQQQQPSEEEGSKDQMQTLMGQDDEISPTTMNDLQQQNQQQMGENHQLTGSSFLPTVDNIKSFLPTGQPSPSSLNFQSFPQNLIPRTSGSGLNQDLQLSLQSYHNPALLPQHQSHHTQQDQAIFSGPTQLGFDGSSAAGGWSSESEHHHHAPPSEMGLFQKILAWNAADDVSGSSIGGGAGGGGGGGGFPFSSPPSMQLHILQPLGPKNQFFLQRGPLQSSDTPSIRAWIDPGINLDHHHHHHHHHQINPPAVHHLPALPVTGFALGGFSGFQIQARIQGDQEERDGIPNQLSSASSDSCH